VSEPTAGASDSSGLHHAAARLRLGTAGVAGISLIVMVSSTVWPFTFGVLAPLLLDELALTPGSFGLIYAAYYASAAVGSPWVGRMADRLPFRHSMHLMALGTIVHVGLFSASRSLLWLLPGAMIAGVVMASANPFTNSLIISGLRDGSVRLAVGLKQGGVPIAAVLTGWLVPLVTGWINWRVGVLSLMLLPILVSIAALSVTGSGPMAGPSGQGREELRAQRRAERRIPIERTGLETYALLLGVVTAGLNGYLPLFTNQELAGSLARGGALLAAFAAAGAIGRFLWSILGRRGRATRILFGLPLVGSAALFGIAFARDEIMVWPLVVVAGLTVMAWQGIGTIAIIDMGTRSVGRTSGRVLQFFYVGFVVGAPLMGVVVDRVGYGSGWSMLGVFALCATVSLIPRLRAEFSSENRLTASETPD